MLSLFCKLTAKCISLLGKKKKKKPWQVPMASLSSTQASSRRWQEGWHKTCFLQASYLRGTWLLRSLSILPNDVIAGCHLVYLECAASQINMLFNCRSRYRVILPANAWDTSDGTDLGREMERDQSCHQCGTCYRVENGAQHCVLKCYYTVLHWKRWPARL